MSPRALLVLACGLLLALHLAGMARDRPRWRTVGKLGASAAFLLLALAVGVDTPFRRLVLGGLALSAVGDALLLSRRRSAFLAGLGAFLLAHLAYAAAFAPRSRPAPWLAPLIALMGAAVLRWLWSHLGSMKAPVVAYCLAISAMLWLALGVAHTEVRLGALLFFASDLFVARDRFLAPGPVNRWIGLPLYYAGQVLLALAPG
jgi:uncharacterized membrane protein YhhN